MPGSTLRRRVICRSSFLLYRLLGVDLRPQLCDGHVERLQVRLQALDLVWCTDAVVAPADGSR